MTLEQLRAMALGMADTSEAPHHQLGSFRVRGKIFATFPADGSWVNVFVDEHTTRARVDQEPAVFELVHWGEKLAGLRVVLARANAEDVRELLEEAWERKGAGAAKAKPKPSPKPKPKNG